MMKELIPPANKVFEGYVFTGVCLSIGGGGGSLHPGGRVCIRRGLDRPPPPIGYYGIRSTSGLYAFYWFAFSFTKLLDVFFLLQRVLKVKRRAEAWPTRWSWSRRPVTRPPRDPSPRPRSDPSHRNSSTRNSRRLKKGDRFVERFILPPTEHRFYVTKSILRILAVRTFRNPVVQILKCWSRGTIAVYPLRFRCHSPSVGQY